MTMTHRVLDVFIAFLKLGLTSFGGPVAHIGYFHKDFVERRQWLNEQQFAQLLGLCQLLPGPASSQLGFCLGLMRAGWLGALAAFAAFTLPSVLLLLGFAVILPQLSNTVGQAALHGLKIVAFAIVTDAVIGMYSKLCPDRHRAGMAIASAVVVLFLGSVWGQLIVIAAGGIAGYFLCNSQNNPGYSLPVQFRKKTGAILLAIFSGLFFILPMLAGMNGGIVWLADTFFRVGALVFGGGHVVLPLLENAVVAPGLLTQEAFLAGYGASQAIPGPLFSIAAYIGALVAPEGYMWLGAIAAVAAIFLPGFLLIAGVLPFWKHLGQFNAVNNVFAGVNAVVVGLLGAALYNPVFTSAIVGTVDMAIGLVAIAALRVWRLPPLLVVIGCVSATLLNVVI